MNLTLRVWRQASPSAKGKLVDYTATDISPDMSFLEMLDVVNEGLIKAGQDPIAFDSDCREGICGTCAAWSRRGAWARRGHNRCQLKWPHRGRRTPRHRAVAS